MKYYVDGSYNPDTRTCGYGVVGVNENDEIAFLGNGENSHPGWINMRNVGGELLGAIAAINHAVFLNDADTIIYYDYKGIEKWATGEWKRNNPYTEMYHNLINDMKQKGMNIKFVKVKAHSGVKYNEKADQLARNSVGIF